MTIMLTREQALDELLRVETQLHDLQNRRKDLRLIVLASSSAAHKAQPHDGPPPKRRYRGGISEHVLRIVQKSGPITLPELAKLNGPSATPRAVDQTLQRLRKKGLVKCDKSHHPQLWTLAIHADHADKGDAP